MIIQRLLTLVSWVAFMAFANAQNDSITWQYACGVWEGELHLVPAGVTSYSFQLADLPLDTELQLRAYSAGGEFKKITFQHDAHLKTELWTSPLLTTDQPTTVFITSPVRSSLSLREYPYFPKGEVTPQQFSPFGDSCDCLLPAWVIRENWCSGDCPITGTPAPTAVSHFIVHHSAGANMSSNWAAVVEAIYRTHTAGNGWADIGYNYLIDPNGVVYEGRGEDIRGAHFCGNNSNTMGVCVMGNFMETEPTAAALGALENLLAWKACRDSLDVEDFNFHTPTGLNLFTISGHRDGCATACPGDQFYPLLPAVRTLTAGLIEPCVQLTPPQVQLDTLLGLPGLVVLWDSISEPIDGVILTRSADNGAAVALGQLSASTTRYIDADIDRATEYCYQLRSFSGSDTSQISTAVCGAVPLVSSTFEESVQLSSLAPNPCRTSTRWTSSQAVRVKVLDALGREYYRSDALVFEGAISTVSWASGIYFCVFENEHQTWITQLVRQ